MLQEEVYKNFKSMFPQIEKDVERWFPNGMNSIRVRKTNGHEFIFTYNEKIDWCFETVGSFIKHMKGDYKM